MSEREITVLGTASQVPTRERNHHGLVLRWDDAMVLFDPGEGTQRQMRHADITPSRLTHVLITHFHGDHCLGLPGVLQRMALDGTEAPLEIHYPAGGQDHMDALLHLSPVEDRVLVRQRPSEPGHLLDAPPFALEARRLDHGAETLGWRLWEPDGRTLLPERLEAAGVHGPAVGELQRLGAVTIAGRTVRLEDVSVPRPGQSLAFVMDTRWCDAALELARDVDVLICEATFLERHADLADRYAHLTAAQAAVLAREAGAASLVLTHFSQRYPDLRAVAAEARSRFEPVTVARDLDRIPLPPRR